TFAAILRRRPAFRRWITSGYDPGRGTRCARIFFYQSMFSTQPIVTTKNNEKDRMRNKVTVGMSICQAENGFSLDETFFVPVSVNIDRNRV
ncbi:MAG: hypothetical protein IJZ19_13910, partial [Lentisphaeria bacterium]|nr:hypothetical protein [Lentisphaeria bacterium]